MNKEDGERREVGRKKRESRSRRIAIIKPHDRLIQSQTPVKQNCESWFPRRHAVSFSVVLPPLSSPASSVAAGRSAPSTVVAFGAAFLALDLALALVGRANEGPVHADGLTQQVAAIQRLHGRLSLFVRLVLYQRVTWGKMGGRWMERMVDVWKR